MEGEQFPEPAITNIFPLCRSAVWIGLMGMEYGRVLHWPWTFTWAQAPGMRPTRTATSAATTPNTRPDTLLAMCDLYRSACLGGGCPRNVRTIYLADLSLFVNSNGPLSSATFDRRTLVSKILNQLECACWDEFAKHLLPAVSVRQGRRTLYPWGAKASSCLGSGEFQPDLRSSTVVTRVPAQGPVLPGYW